MNFQMIKHSLLLALVAFTGIYGCGSSKPTAVATATPPSWFSSTTQKIANYYAYQNAPIADSLKNKSVAITLKNGSREMIDLSDVAEVIYYARKLKLKEEPLLADAFSDMIQGLQTAKRLPEYNTYAEKLFIEASRLATSAAFRADSITLAIHQQINRLDAEYRHELTLLTDYQTRHVVFFTAHYEKMKQLIALEQETLSFGLAEYRKAIERLKLSGLNESETISRREQFLQNIYGLIASRIRQMQTAVSNFTQRVQQDNAKEGFLEAANHYETLTRLSNESLSKLKAQE